ncbi:3947_t:CDS:2, partial [Acaulospora colombiana]
MVIDLTNCSQEKYINRLDQPCLLFSYQEVYPGILVKLQEQCWHPIIDWVQKYYEVDIKTTNGITGMQLPETKDRLKSVVEKFGNLKLSGLGLVERKLTVEEAFKATQVETISQTMKWGELED